MKLLAEATGEELQAMVDEARGKRLLGAARGSDAPDCCATWTRSGKLVEFLGYESHRKQTAKMAPWNFCPWCGRARQNEKLKHGGE